MNDVNWYYVGAGIFGVILLIVALVLIVHHLRTKAEASAATNAKAMHAYLSDVVENHPHTDPAPKAAVAQAPAAPAASVAAEPPPAAAAPAASEPAAAPSSGGGGTLKVNVVVTAADKVAAKHAQLDALIAAGKKAQADKEVLLATQAQLDQLTEAA